MSACQLKIELDEPNRTRKAGELVTGQVVVQSDKDIRCKGLTVTSYWTTHGRGNTARGDVELSKLFEGEWQSGKEYRYPFKLATANWPPTYYGTLLNVSHFVQAQAALPWASDPKALVEYTLYAVDSPADLAPTSNQVKKSGWLGWIFGPILLLLLAMFIPILLFLLIPISIIAAVYWVIRVLIPSQITGKVSYTIDSPKVAPGEELRGKCLFTPKRTSQINGILWTIKCEEKCVSGSGSNRSTHTHEVLSKKIQLAGPGALQAGQNQSFDLIFKIPPSAPPSLKFSDNEINWTCEFRIDIPKWPDWIKSLPITVKTSEITEADVAVPEHEESEDDKWLRQVFDQILQCEDEPERLSNVLEAVGEQWFDVRLVIQGESEEPFESEIEEEGLWLNAIDRAKNVRVVLFVPNALLTEEMPWIKDWRGKAKIIGLEEDNLRVMMHAVG